MIGVGSSQSNWQQLFLKLGDGHIQGFLFVFFLNIIVFSVFVWLNYLTEEK